MRTNKKTHEQFLKELWIKNKHYREGKFRVVGQYKATRFKIGVMNHLNTLLMPKAMELLKGSLPTIMSAADKSQYFRNLCYYKFGEDDTNDLKEIKYINNRIRIKVFDKDYGEYFIRPQDYLNGDRHPRKGREIGAEKNRSNKKDIVDKIKLLHPNLEILPFDYITIGQKILAKDKYGVCNVSLMNLLSGHTPSIRTAVDKNKYFANRAIEVHGDKYDYSLVEYKNGDIKVKIISKHGIFEQKPNDHLRGFGCPAEGRKVRSNHMRNNPTGWTYTNWELSAKRSKYFKGYKVYFIECWDRESHEKFYKIGKTYIDVKSRFYGKRIPYAYTILKVVETASAREACKLEQEYKNKHKEFKYVPSKKFAGMYECFSSLNIDLQTT